MQVNNANIGERVKAIRNKSKLTQEAFAESIGVTRSVLSQIEIGVNKPSTELIATIKRKYNCSYEFLMDGQEGQETIIIAESNKENINNMDDKEKYIKLLEDTNKAYLRQLEAQERTIAELRRTVEIEALRGEMRAKDKTILLLEERISKDPKLTVSKNKD